MVIIFGLAPRVLPRYGVSGPTLEQQCWTALVWEQIGIVWTTSYWLPLMTSTITVLYQDLCVSEEILLVQLGPQNVELK